MNQPLVSVITPIYNGYKYIDQCVESVVLQSYENWELLLIDDGSTDQSLEKIYKWINKDSRIKFLAHPNNSNKGVSLTRNLGITYSSGKYIALLDCDDIWFSEKLQKQVEILEDDPELTLVYCKAVVIDDDGFSLDKSNKNIEFPHIAGNGYPGKHNIFNELLNEIIWIPCPTVVFPKKIINEIGGFQENLKHQCEDLIFFILASNLGAAYFINDFLAEYRIHSNSYTSKNPWQISIFEVYETINKKLPQYHCKIKYSCRKKLTDLLFFYFFDSLKRKFVFDKIKVFFNKKQEKKIIIGCFFEAIFFRAKKFIKKFGRKMLKYYKITLKNCKYICTSFYRSFADFFFL